MPTDVEQGPPVVQGCTIANTTVIPELVRIRAHVDDVIRDHRAHDDRLNRLNLQADDANRRLTRLESLVETQSREAHELARRFDSLDSKVSFLVESVERFGGGIDSLMKAFNEHGITSTEQHNKRMRGQMTLWVTLGGSVVILSAMHYQATGNTALESLFAVAGKLFQ
jgi:hypothetical protein